MPNNYLSVLYKHIIQVENKNEGLKAWGGRGGGGHKHTTAPQSKKWGAHAPLIPPPPRFLRQCNVPEHTTGFPDQPPFSTLQERLLTFKLIGV